MQGTVRVVEINLLGPMEVLRHGVALTPSAPKLRTVLSLLAVQASIVVRTDKIIEELWEDNPPASVTTTLQTYIYQLRKLLRLGTPPNMAGAGDTPADAALRTSPYGYALILDPDMLDTMRFERLSDQGRRELEAGDMNAAAETLSHALRLWRGPALVDVGHGPVLRAEGLRLEEMYKNALERRIEADLHLGRHHELLGELTRLAAEQSTHEGFQAKLMLALHRAGRRSEALKIYQRTRSALATELGLDPSSELEQLHRAVLAADESLALPRPRTPVRISRTRPPRQLPPEGTALVGRQPQVSALLAALSARQHHAPPVVVITGPPGSGKSALCKKVGHRANGPYTDAQLYARLVDAHGRPADPRDVLAAFLRALDVPEDRIPATLSERTHLFRTWTADRHVLVTLDDVVRTDQLLPLVPASPDCGVLVTARRQISVPEVTATVEVGPLNAEEGLRLLTNVLGDHRIAQDEATARELVRLCDGLPAALQAAAARLQLRPHWPISKLIKVLRGETMGPRPTGNHDLVLYPSVELSYRLMPPAVQSAFRVLTRLDVSAFTPRRAARLLRISEPQTEALLDELVEFQLMTAEPGDGEPDPLQYRFLPSVRAAGRRLPADERDALLSPVYQTVPATRAALDDGCVGGPAVAKRAPVSS
ncbi:BTAD domain-containing putative transcriptional regulator [Nonomuraea sp. GTA35]|uniref:AfsR/SARP family transcriptional regulator n=1 Tax=Nonomuraea sp. GTA35 TaxID=1676746 RepID=UPI0035BF44E7